MNQKTVIANMDLRSSVPAEKKLSHEIYRISKDSHYLGADSYDQALDNVYKHYRKLAELHDERESMMPDRFEEELAVILEKYPELKNKPELNIVFTMGSAHSAELTKLFRGHGIPFKREFPATPDYVYEYRNQLSRTFSAGLEPQRELLERVYASDVVAIAWQAFAKPVGDLPDGVSYDSFIASQLTPEQMRKLFQRVQDTEGSGIVEYLDSILKEMGLPTLLRTPEEHKAFARDHTPGRPRKSIQTSATKEEQLPRDVDFMRRVRDGLELL